MNWPDSSWLSEWLRLARIVLALFCSVPVMGSTYYVATNGSNANPGTIGSPWLTIGKAASVVSSGDTVNVGAGTFNEFITISTSGTSGNQITFNGMRGGSGEYLTVIDPSTDASSGWVAAPEIGSGVYKKTGLPFNTREMTIGGKRTAFVWDAGDISDSINNAYVSSGLTNGSQILNLSSNATLTTQFGATTIAFWDNVKAIFGTTNTTTTYLSLADKSNPNGLLIRISPNRDDSFTFDMIKPAVALDGSYITLQNFQIQGAWGAVRIFNSSNNIVQNNNLLNGYARVWIGGASASNNHVRTNSMSANYYGTSDIGAWTSTLGLAYTNTLRKHVYIVSKFLMGQASVADHGVRILGAGSSNQIYANTIYGGMGEGILIGSTTAPSAQGTSIYGNSIHNNAAHGLMLWPFETSTLIYDNQLIDNLYPFRYHLMDQAGEGSNDRSVYIYRNTCWNPWNAGGMTYIHFGNSSGATNWPTFWCYNNSFSGGEFGIDPSGYADANGGLPRCFWANNVISGTPWIGGGASLGLMTNAAMVGGFDYNEITPPPVTYPTSSDPAWWGPSNVKASSPEWDTNTVQTVFKLKPGSLAIDSGLNLTQSFTLKGTNYSSLPQDGTAKIGAAWDMGALEFTGILNPSRVRSIRIGTDQGPPGISGGYFIDYASGSDSNSGTNSSVPWKHHPFMRPFAGTYTHQPGDQFFFKGGVTWSNVAFQMRITTGGNAATNDYYGTKAGFGSGLAVFDLENKLVTNSAGFTDFQKSAAVLLDGSSSAVQYITFNGIEVKRLRIPHGSAAQGASCFDQFGRVNHITYTNCYIHDWDMATISSGDDGNAAGGIFQNTAMVDISGCSIANCSFTQAGVSQRCGGAIHGFFTVTGCTISNVCEGIFNSGTWTSNVVHDVEAATDPSNHPNALYAQFPSTLTGNVLSNISTSASAIYCSPNSNYNSNNWYLVYNNVVSTDGNQEPISYDPEASNTGGARFLNNTLIRPGGGSQACIRLGNKPGAGNAGPVIVENNHFITASGTPISIDSPSGYSSLITSSNILQTPSAAGAQGYLQSNVWQPTPGGATIHAGTNLTAQGYSTDRLGVSRGSTWDAGAYQKP